MLTGFFNFLSFAYRAKFADFKSYYLYFGIACATSQRAEYEWRRQFNS